MQEKNKDILYEIGSDESGKGDSFGPIFIVVALIEEKDTNYLINLGIKDSKKISNKKILEMGKKLLNDNIVKLRYMKISPSEYNKAQENNINVVEMLTKCHLTLLKNIKERNNIKKCLFIIDKFTTENSFYGYSDIRLDNLIFVEKAESKYLSVATASVVARYLFLLEMKKYKKELKITIPLGSSSEMVKITARKVIENKNINYENYLKVSFKNIKEIINEISKNKIL